MQKYETNINKNNKYKKKILILQKMNKKPIILTIYKNNGQFIYFNP